MISPDGVYHPDFDLGDFRYAVARYVKLLIRARWKIDPGFCSDDDLRAWSLQDISADAWPPWILLNQAAVALGMLNTQFLPRCGSGGVRETDQSTPEGRLIGNVAGLAQLGDDGGPCHNDALLDAARRLHDGKDVDWGSLVAWETLEAIRSDLDQLPHPRTKERSDDRLEQPHNKVIPLELPRREAAQYLGVSVETLLKLQQAGLIRYRNASPPGSGKPRYRYPIADLDRVMQQGYHRDPSKARKVTNHRREQVKRQSYEHLDLD